MDIGGGGHEQPAAAERGSDFDNRAVGSVTSSRDSKDGPLRRRLHGAGNLTSIQMPPQKALGSGRAEITHMLRWEHLGRGVRPQTQCQIPCCEETQIGPIMHRYISSLQTAKGACCQRVV